MSKVTKTPESTSTAVATGIQFTVNDVPKLLEQVTAKINAIKKGIPESPETTGELENFGKISEIDSVEDLIKAYSSVTTKEEFYKKAAAAILPAGIKCPPLKLSGHSPSAWIKDIEARIVIVANKTELAKLEKVKAKLEENLSAEAKLSKDLADCANILKD